MTFGNRIARVTLTAAAALLLTACGDKPDSLLASARDYLAKEDPKAAAIQVKSALQKNPNSAEARFLLGKALLMSGDAAGAEVELRRALEGKYSADATVPLLADTMLATGQAKKLLSEFGKTELTTPDAKAELATSIGMAYASLGQVDKAKELAEGALALKPDHPRAMIFKTRLLLSGRDVPGAVAVLDSLLAKDAKNPEGWSLKGDILAGQGKTDEALAAYRKAVDAKPDYARAYAAMITLLVRQDRLDDAGVQLEAMKKAAPKNMQTMLSEAEYLYQRKDYKRSLELAQNLLRLQPNDAKILLLAGANHLQLNSLVQAQDLLARTVKLVPGLVSARRMLATVYLRTGQPGKALAAIEPILVQADQDSALLSLAGDIYMQNGNVQKADEFFSKAAALDPSNPSKQTKVALTHIAEGKGDAAFAELERISAADAGTAADMAMIAAAIKARDFNKAMKAIDGLDKKRPNDAMVHALRGGVLIAKGDLAAARKSLEKALTIKPAYYPAAASLAALDLKDNKLEDARKRFEGVLAADPKNVQAGLALADMKARGGASVDDVAAQVSKVIQSNPEEPAPRLALVSLYLQARDAKKAVAAAQDGLAVLPDRVELLDLLTRGQQLAGDTNQALATCAKLSALMPGAPQPYLRMAEINVAAKNKDAAIQNLRKALDLKPDLVPAQRGLVVLYLDAKNYSEAQSVVAEVKKQRPKEPLGYLFEGDIAAERKAWPDAVAAYRAGLKAVPGTTELATRLYAALRAGGSDAEADKFAAEWLADRPKDAGFRQALAESATVRKDYPTAIRHYQSLLALQPDNPIVLNNIAWVLAQVKDPKALEYSEKANRISPNQPAIMETLGMLLLDKGDVARAMEVLQKALELAPQSAPLKLSLARAQAKAGKTAEARKNLDELAKLGDRFPAQADVSKLLKEIGN